MHIELAELLRCPLPHVSSPLVIVSQRMEARVVLDGMLGCPVCGASYRIEGGVAQFISVTHLGDATHATHTTLATPSADDGAVSDRSVMHEASIGSPDPQPLAPDDVMRMAAMLDASRPNDTFAFLKTPLVDVVAMQHVAPVRAVALFASIAPDERNVRHALLGAPAPLGVIVLNAGAPALPFAAGSLAGVHAAGGAEIAFLRAGIAAVRSGGRIAGPASMPLPEGTTELLRDGSHWVAVRNAAAPTPAALTQLRRRRD